MRHKLAGLTRGFSRDTQGNFAVATAAIASVLMLGIGYGINVAQLYTIRSDLSHALDAAVTSTARDLTTGKVDEKEARARVELFLKANADTQFTRPDSIVLAGLVVDRTARTVDATAYVDADLLFPMFGSSGTRRVTAQSAALYSDKRIEVAMMLDITGSMQKTWNTDKIGDLKKAATSAVTSLLGDQDPKSPRIRVAIVPYADAVNTGPLAHTVHVERNGVSDLPSGLDDARPVGGSRPDDCATERKAANGKNKFKAALSDASPYTAMVNRDDRLEFCPDAPLFPLTADSDVLLASIDAFKADGVTAGHIGVEWTRYMLSPKWKTVLNAAVKGSAPAAYTDKGVAKVAILMTDGEFNTAYAGVAGNQQPLLQQGSRSRSYAETLCHDMREDGIEIYTIGFMLPNADAKGVMKNCATPDTGKIKHYFETSTGEELDAAFKEIVRNLERLAITR